MSNDKMRAEFEKWAKVRDLPIATVYFGLTRSYVDLRTAWAFEGWRDGQPVEWASCWSEVLTDETKVNGEALQLVEGVEE